jgi:alkylation response protein AidB-like acyl-CoA dehydrogenase
MNLAPDEFQTEIGETARNFLADRLSIAKIRKLAKGEAAIGDAEWAALCEMGWLSILVPETAGGLGLGVAEADKGEFRAEDVVTFAASVAVIQPSAAFASSSTTSAESTR